MGRGAVWIGFWAALACAGRAVAEPDAGMPDPVRVASILSAPLLQDASRPDLPDPSPETAPSFGTGYRPDAWEAWDVPPQLRRLGFALDVGTANFYRQGTALKMDNPTLYLTSTEYVEYQSLWEASNVGFSLRGELRITPMISAVFEPTFCSFQREVSPPNIYVTYQDANNNQRLLSVDNLTVFTCFFSARLSFPWNVVLFEPENLFRWSRASEPSAFVPFFLIGAGVSFTGAVEASVYRTEGGVSANEKRALYAETWNLAGMVGLGLEYRLSIFGLEARAIFSDVGKPASAWGPHTDFADTLSTYHLQLGIAIYLF
jgi:hypothetical protein